MESNGYDFDLFFRFHFSQHFPSMNIHIATAGGDIPRELYSKVSHARARRFFKWVSNNDVLEYKINPGIEEIFFLKEGLWRGGKAELPEIKYELDRDSYLSDFIEYAKGGCFSFDRTNINEDADGRYHLVAYPHSIRRPFPLAPALGVELDADGFARRFFKEPVLFSFDDFTCTIHSENGNIIGIGRAY